VAKIFSDSVFFNGGIRACTNCGGDPRLFAELTKRPQVPAKSAWPCATKKQVVIGTFYV